MRRLVGTLALVGLVAGTATAAAGTAAFEKTGTMYGANYEVRVPDNWNGTLVVYAHGYRDAADHPGEVDDTSASAFVADPFEEVMLAAGYAIAGSSYRDNGWAVREGIQDTKVLARNFRRFAPPERTILFGVSMGSVITYESIEEHTETYDGAIPACSVGAGAPAAFDGTIAVAAAYDAMYGWPAAWGTPGDVRDDLDFETEVLPVLVGQFLAPDGFAKFEAMRLAAGIPAGPEWPFSIWFFTTEGRAELERRAGGPVVQNLNHTYTIDQADRSYLAALGLGSSDIDTFLAAMDGVRFSAPKSSRKYVEKYADYTGLLTRPVLTLHTVVDALVPPAHVSAYTERVEAAGRSDYLASAWTTGVGHCNFTPDQALAAVDAMDDWLRTGQRPTAADFPASLGFTDFTPPPWPQPIG